MGYSPKECVDYLCLVGDKSDDIPGYKGIGPVKARKFLDEFGSIENFLSNKDNEFNGIDFEGLEDLYKRNKPLIDIRVALKEYPLDKIPVIFYKKDTINTKKLQFIFKEYTLGSFLTSEFIKPFKTLKSWKNSKE